MPDMMPSPSAVSGRARPGSEAARAAAALKARDNTTNWLHLAWVWAVIVATIGGALLVEQHLIASGQSLWWMLPVIALAAVVTGASQHQLGGAIHEGTHYILFANKTLNELASDWLAAFPIYTSTYQYRVHHLAHHQFVNDPERDPDISQLIDSNHWLDFPVTHVEVLAKLLKQIWIPNLIRFTLVRARYSAVGHDDNPYIDAQDRGSKVPVRVGILFALGAPALMNVMCRVSGAAATWTVLIAFYVAVVAYFLATPEAKFAQTRLLPVISHKATAIGRVSFMMLMYSAFTFIDAGTGATWAWDRFGLYWVLPLFTTFPLFMMMRQWVQHGNADRGRYTNTRTFLVGPLIRYSVFPWGMDYHLGHHLMASVPHYNLKRLHALMLNDPAYAEKGVIVEGYFGHDDPHTGRPTALSALGPKHAPTTRDAAYVDNATLEYADVKDKAAIAAEAEASARED